MIVTIYQKSTGEILRVVDAPEDMIDLQLNEGEQYINGSYPDDQFYISRKSAKAKPPKPNDDYEWNPKTKKWVYTKTEADFATEAIYKRNHLLFMSDWTQGLDSPLSDEDREAWQVYRQHLRDITQQTDFPFTIDWGTPPNEE